MDKSEAKYLGLRYFLLIALGLFNLKIFYFVFTPLTVYPSYWFLSIIFHNASLLEGNLLFFGGFYAQIISACVAGAAYYLLLILNMTTPMPKMTRIKSILFLFGMFLIINVARILIFSSLLVSGYQYFDLTHELTWYFGSTVMVVLIWFVNVWLFDIEHIPIYTDMKNLFEDVKERK